VFASDASIAAIGASAARAPDDPNYVPGLIRAEFATGNAAAALARAQSLAAAGSGAAAAHLALGDALMVSARHRDAAAAFTRAADLAFDEPTMLRLVGSLERAGAPRDAAAVLALFVAQNPDNLTALRLLGQRQRAAGLFDAAIATLERVRRRGGDGDASVLAELALAHAEKGRGAPAVRLAKRAYALAPLDPLVVAAYAAALAAAGNGAGARQLAEKRSALD
jgi:tetratricopeptide (TPR) repeat protein